LNIQLTCRHGALSEKLRDYATKKTERLLRHFDGVHTVELILSSEGTREKAEMIVGVVRGRKCVAEATDDDVYAAVDTVVDRAIRQVSKLKGKLRERHGRPTPPPPAPEVEET